MNIYMTGVGGQGIGLLSEVLLRALDRSGAKVKGVDTHGLAQRGGVVVSQIRTGEGEFSPLIAPGEADAVLALERHEALRGMNGFLRDGGSLAYYDAVWQPFDVRSGSIPEITSELIEQTCRKRGISVYRVYREDLPDPRMQNTALLRTVLEKKLIPELTMQSLEGALEDLLSGEALAENLRVLRGSEFNA